MPKTLESSCWFALASDGRKLVWLGLALALAMGGTVGCKPKAKVGEAPAPDTASADAAAPTAPPPNAVAAAPSDLPRVDTATNGDPDMKDLNRYLLRWAVGHQKRPASFEEFAADPGVQIPPPPAGKKYKLDSGSMHIVLVNQ
jgi:hypothetical protein